MAKKNAPARLRSAGQGKDGAQPREFRGLLIRVNNDGLKAIRVLAADRDTSIQALGIEAWNDLLVKYDRKPALKNPLLPEE